MEYVHEFSIEEKKDLLQKEPQAEKFIRGFMGADEFLNGKTRWCLWLVDARPQELRDMPEILRRIEKVRKFRLASKAASTQTHAATPGLFRDINHPKKPYLIVPSASSERRRFIPIGFIGPDVVANNLNFIVEDVSLYHLLKSKRKHSPAAKRPRVIGNMRGPELSCRIFKELFPIIHGKPSENGCLDKLQEVNKKSALTAPWGYCIPAIFP